MHSFQSPDLLYMRHRCSIFFDALAPILSDAYPACLRLGASAKDSDAACSWRCSGAAALVGITTTDGWALLVLSSRRVRRATVAPACAARFSLCARQNARAALTHT